MRNEISWIKSNFSFLPVLLYVATLTSPTVSTNQNKYIPRGRNVLHTIFENHFQDFIGHYEEKYEKNYGKYRLDRIISLVNTFLDCGDYIKAEGHRCPQVSSSPQASSCPQGRGRGGPLGSIARIRCVNFECGFDYFVPFSHWRGSTLPCGHLRPAKVFTYAYPAHKNALFFSPRIW